MVRGNKSIVWYFFKKTLEGRHGICRICHQSLKYFGGTSNFKQHLIRKHRMHFNKRLKEIRERGESSELHTYRTQDDAETKIKSDRSDEDYTENIHKQKTEAHEVFINDTPDGEEATLVNSSCVSPTSSPTNPLGVDHRRTVAKENLFRSSEPVYRSSKFSSGNTSQNKQSLDECEMFGKIVASHLRQLPLSVALECQSDILHHLVQKRLGRSDSRIHSYSTENGSEEIIVQAWESAN